MTELRYEPLPRIRQRLPFKHPLRRARRLRLFLVGAGLGLGLAWLLVARVCHAGDPTLETGRLIWQMQQEGYDSMQRERFHQDHETDRRLYGINPPQEEIRTYRLPEGDDDGDDE